MKPRIIGPEKIKHRSYRFLVKGAKLKFPNGNVANWEYIDHPDVVAILPIDKAGNVYLVREWRLPWKREVLSIPAGVCNGRTARAKLVQARNELREETGMDAKHIKKLTSFYAAASIRLNFNVYLATGLFPSFKEPDENEFIQVVKMPFAKAYKLFLTGKETTTSSTLIAFSLAKEILK
jgi:ADP-ribose pyrophosphatase